MTDDTPDTQLDVDPAPEPATEPYDPHTGPLDDDDDGRYLNPSDPRRLAAEQRRGKPFAEDEGHHMGDTFRKLGDKVEDALEHRKEGD